MTAYIKGLKLSVTKNLFCFGLGYSSLYCTNLLKKQGFNVWGTVRSPEKLAALEEQGVKGILWSDSETIIVNLQNATHILHSIPPQDGIDPVFSEFMPILKGLNYLEWLGYFSTTGVYGDHQGGWVDENTKFSPPNERLRWRCEFEQKWLESGLPVHIFRLAGIYGKGRSAIEKIKSGTAKRIDKPGQVFSRINVEDIANVIAASIARPNPGEIYNVADDEPAPQNEVIEYAANLLGVAPPPLVKIEEANLSPMGLSFYQQNRRVSNRKIKEELGVELKYPSFRDYLFQQLSS